RDPHGISSLIWPVVQWPLNEKPLLHDRLQRSSDGVSPPSKQFRTYVNPPTPSMEQGPSQCRQLPFFRYLVQPSSTMSCTPLEKQPCLQQNARFSKIPMLIEKSSPWLEPSTRRPQPLRKSMQVP